MHNREQISAITLALLGVTATAADAQTAARSAQGKPAPQPAVRTASVAASTGITRVEVAAEAGHTRITIVGNQPFTPRVSTFGNKATVIDIDGKWLPGRGKVVPVGKNGISTVRYGQFAVRPEARVRITANTVGALAAAPQSSADGTQWEIVIAAPGNELPVVTARTASVAPVEAAAPAVSATSVNPRGIKAPAKAKAVAKAPVKAPVKAPAKAALKPAVPARRRAEVASAGFIKPLLPMPTSTTTPRGLLAQATKPAPQPHKPAAKATVRAAGYPGGMVVTRSRSLGTGPYSGLIKMPEVPVLVLDEAYLPAPRVIQASQETPRRQPPAGQVANATDNGTLTPGDDMARKVSLDFVAADINDVLKALSLQSGVNIVTGSDVKGTITVSLKRVSLTEALEMVTRLSGFTYARFGNAYVVGTPASVAAITNTTERPVERITEFIPYRYTSSAMLYRILEERFPGLKLPEIPKEELPSQPKMLVLIDSPARAAEVREFVAKLEQVASLPVQGAVTDIYEIRYASPADLINILSRLVPTISVQLGPSQGFQPNALGGSASFQSATPPAGGGATPAPAGGGGAAGGAVGASGAGGAGGAGGVTGAATGGPRVPPPLLLLTGAPTDIVKAKEVLARIDIKIPQIAFEARVLDVNNEDVDRFGLSYDFSRTVQIGENNVAPGTATVGTLDAPGPGRPVNFGTIFRTPYSIGVQLDALVTQGKSRLLANPTLSALDGQPAVVFIGDQIKYVIAIQQTPTGQTISTETATVGITLRVTGKTSPDGTITLYVHPEVSTVRDFLQVGGGIALPQISTRFVDTTIRVKDGDTIAIGGLIREQDIDNIRKVPVLGDLPFFGKLLFQSRQKTKSNSTLMVFITSRILP